MIFMVTKQENDLLQLIEQREYGSIYNVEILELTEPNIKVDISTNCKLLVLAAREYSYFKEITYHRGEPRTAVIFDKPFEWCSGNDTRLRFDKEESVRKV